MDSGYSKEDGTTARRRSARTSSKTDPSSLGAVPLEKQQEALIGNKKSLKHQNQNPTIEKAKTAYSAYVEPRPQLKRSRKMREEDGASRTVNGSKKSKSLKKGDDDDDDDESPVKKKKLKETEKVREINERGDGFKHTDEEDVEMGEDEDQDQEDQDQDMNSDEGSEQEQDNEPSLKVDSSAQPGTIVKHLAYAFGENLRREEIVGSRMSIHQKPVDHEIDRLKTQTKNYRPNTTSRDPSSSGAVPLEKQQDALMRNKNSLKYENQNPTMEKAKNAPCSGNWNRYQSAPLMSNVYPTIKHPITIPTTHHKNIECKNLQKPVTSKPRPVSSSRGWLWYRNKLLWCSLILTGVLALAYQIFLHFHLRQTDMSHSETIEKFDLDLVALRTLFPSQRSVFWKRSGKHLKRHLEMVSPTEPVSVILTAGLQAERTLGCLARSLAMAYSTFRNASILEISGITKKAKDSDQVKLEIDEALKEAFEGDKPAAVVHRFEELPPGSTLIFYRYCDHENAAYKKVFLVFTVMLSVREIDPVASLSAVEDMVHDHVKQKFVSSDKSAKFNQMDVDKLSGLWSRISHVILPVVSEDKIERQGCRY
ncbi:torsin-1A-interacting protein 2-like isoform X3 [Pimephales promelas]|uniref:torsin-1A-interacting protein 2-like isoform X3 n=1 Tax=Pimephales promelas TaxID=90988 RepID=UPI001955AA6F|nr:torsin-1A-interacting protein 2-like isoform X3 [Pimephales promelas]